MILLYHSRRCGSVTRTASSAWCSAVHMAGVKPREGFGGGTSAAKWAAAYPDWPSLRDAVLTIADESEQVMTITEYELVCGHSCPLCL